MRTHSGTVCGTPPSKSSTGVVEQRPGHGLEVVAGRRFWNRECHKKKMSSDCQKSSALRGNQPTGPAPKRSGRVTNASNQPNRWRPSSHASPHLQGAALRPESLAQPPCRAGIWLLAVPGGSLRTPPLRQGSLTETLKSLQCRLADRTTLERELERRGVATLYLVHLGTLGALVCALAPTRPREQNAFSEICLLHSR